MAITTPPSIAALPTPPDPADRATFNARAYPWSAALGAFSTQLSAVATNVYDNAGEAQAAAEAAAASAASAVNAPGTSATSTTSLTVGTGSKTLTIQTGKAFAVGQFVVVANTSAPGNYMSGQITAHNSGTGSLTINATSIGGTGTLAAWVVALGVSPTSGGATLTGAEILENKTVKGATFTDGYTEEVATSAASGAAYTVDLANGSIVDLTLTANCTLTFPAVAPGKSFVLYLSQDATGGRTVTWPASVAQPGGTPPTLTTTANKTDRFVLTALRTKWTLAEAGKNYTL